VFVIANHLNSTFVARLEARSWCGVLKGAPFGWVPALTAIS